MAALASAMLLLVAGSRAMSAINQADENSYIYTKPGVDFLSQRGFRHKSYGITPKYYEDQIKLPSHFLLNQNSNYNSLIDEVSLDNLSLKKNLLLNQKMSSNEKFMSQMHDYSKAMDMPPSYNLGPYFSNLNHDHFIQSAYERAQYQNIMNGKEKFPEHLITEQHSDNAIPVSKTATVSVNYVYPMNGQFSVLPNEIFSIHKQQKSFSSENMDTRNSLKEIYSKNKNIHTVSYINGEVSSKDITKYSADNLYEDNQGTSNNLLMVQSHGTVNEDTNVQLKESEENENVFKTTEIILENLNLNKGDGIMYIPNTEMIKPLTEEMYPSTMLNDENGVSNAYHDTLFEKKSYISENIDVTGSDANAGTTYAKTNDYVGYVTDSNNNILKENIECKLNKDSEYKENLEMSKIQTDSSNFEVDESKKTYSGKLQTNHKSYSIDTKGFGLPEVNVVYTDSPANIKIYNENVDSDYSNYKDLVHSDITRIKVNQNDFSKNMKVPNYYLYATKTDNEASGTPEMKVEYTDSKFGGSASKSNDMYNANLENYGNSFQEQTHYKGFSNKNDMYSALHKNKFIRGDTISQENLDLSKTPEIKIAYSTSPNEIQNSNNIITVYNTMASDQNSQNLDTSDVHIIYADTEGFEANKVASFDYKTNTYTDSSITDSQNVKVYDVKDNYELSPSYVTNKNVPTYSENAEVKVKHENSNDYFTAEIKLDDFPRDKDRKPMIEASESEDTNKLSEVKNDSQYSNQILYDNSFQDFGNIDKQSKENVKETIIKWTGNIVSDEKYKETTDRQYPELQQVVVGKEIFEPVSQELVNGETANSEYLYIYDNKEYENNEDDKDLFLPKIPTYIDNFADKIQLKSCSQNLKPKLTSSVVDQNYPNLEIHSGNTFQQTYPRIEDDIKISYSKLHSLIKSDLQAKQFEGESDLYMFDNIYLEPQNTDTFPNAFIQWSPNQESRYLVPNLSRNAGKILDKENNIKPYNTQSLDVIDLDVNKHLYTNDESVGEQVNLDFSGDKFMISNDNIYGTQYLLRVPNELRKDCSKLVYTEPEINPDGTELAYINSKSGTDSYKSYLKSLVENYEAADSGKIVYGSELKVPITDYSENTNKNSYYDETNGVSFANKYQEQDSSTILFGEDYISHNHDWNSASNLFDSSNILLVNDREDVDDSSKTDYFPMQQFNPVNIACSTQQDRLSSQNAAAPHSNKYYLNENSENSKIGVEVLSKTPIITDNYYQYSVDEQTGINGQISFNTPYYSSFVVEETLGEQQTLDKPDTNTYFVNSATNDKSYYFDDQAEHEIEELAEKSKESLRKVYLPDTQYLQTQNIEPESIYTNNFVDISFLGKIKPSLDKLCSINNEYSDFQADKSEVASEYLTEFENMDNNNNIRAMKTEISDENVELQYGNYYSTYNGKKYSGYADDQHSSHRSYDELPVTYITYSGSPKYSSNSNEEYGNIDDHYSLDEFLESAEKVSQKTFVSRKPIVSTQKYKILSEKCEKPKPKPIRNCKKATKTIHATRTHIVPQRLS